MNRELEIYIDGASRGNPGPAGIGVILNQNGQVVKNLSVYLGIQTNNVAEYMALIFGLQEAIILRANTVRVYTDSQLLCRQVNREYKIKSPNLIGLYNQTRHLLSAFDSAEVKYISRDKNRGADKLANKAIKAR
jgi:ribonuclease HI